MIMLGTSILSISVEENGKDKSNLISLSKIYEKQNERTCKFMDCV
jgi:hypothetical protein